MKTLIAALAFAAAPFAASGAQAAEPPRDPFAPFTATDTPEHLGERCGENVAACVSLDDVAVKGIVSGTASPRAMVEVKGGGSAVLRVGDLLGKGRVTAISRNGVVVERVYFSAVSGTVRTKVVMPLG